MGLKESNMIKTVTGATDFSLEAKTGESIRIKDIRVYSPVTNYATLAIDKTTVGYFRVGNTLGNHLDFPANDLRGGKSLLAELMARGIFNGYPVAEGETFKMTGVNQASSRVVVLYDVFDAGDISPTDMNGSKSGDYFYINYGTTGAAVAVAGDALLDTVLNPAEFPAFPFGADVPAKTTITVLGILASEHGTGAAGPTDTLGSEYLKLIKEREVLFDDDKNGIPFRLNAAAFVADAIGGGQGIIGNHSDTDPRPALYFDDPLIFESGEELNSYITYGDFAGAPSLGLDQQEVAFIVKVNRV